MTVTNSTNFPRDPSPRDLQSMVQLANTFSSKGEKFSTSPFRPLRASPKYLLEISLISELARKKFPLLLSCKNVKKNVLELKMDIIFKCEHLRESKKFGENLSKDLVFSFRNQMNERRKNFEETLKKHQEEKENAINSARKLKSQTADHDLSSKKLELQSTITALDEIIKEIVDEHHKAEQKFKEVVEALSLRSIKIKSLPAEESIFFIDRPPLNKAFNRLSIQQRELIEKERKSFKKNVTITLKEIKRGLSSQGIVTNDDVLDHPKTLGLLKNQLLISYFKINRIDIANPFIQALFRLESQTLRAQLEKLMT